MAPVTRITCRATVVARPHIYCRCMAPVTRITCRATVLARPFYCCCMAPVTRMSTVLACPCRF